MTHEGARSVLPIAVDAMGGDKAPDEIVAGARQAADELGVPVVLVGSPERLGDTGGLEVLPASEVIAMEDDPAQGVRRNKDSSLVRAAEAVRDGRASAMVSAGNTGATMASALLRMGRLKGVQRPAIATPIVSNCRTICAGERCTLNPGIDSNLSSVPPVCPNPLPDTIGTFNPQAAAAGAMISEVLSPTPPVECLSSFAPTMPPRSSTRPECSIASVSAANSSPSNPRNSAAINHADI